MHINKDGIKNSKIKVINQLLSCPLINDNSDPSIYSSPIIAAGKKTNNSNKVLIYLIRIYTARHILRMGSKICIEYG